jgi:hypothetical protein
MMAPNRQEIIDAVNYYEEMLYLTLQHQLDCITHNVPGPEFSKYQEYTDELISKQSKLISLLRNSPGEDSTQEESP